MGCNDSVARSGVGAVARSGVGCNDSVARSGVGCNDAPVLLSGSGTSGVSSAFSLPAVATGQYLLIHQLSTSLSWWSAVEIEISCVD